MSGCGGPAGLASPAPSPAPPPPPPRSRMARRPELLCGAAALLAAACLAALKVSCGRAKDVTMPARLPVNFFSSTSPVVDFFLGQLDHAEFVRQDSEIALFFFYAPWCGQSIVARDEIEKVAGSLADQVLFVAINCWWNQGQCRKQKHFFYFPVIYLYHRSFGPIEYKGPLNAVYIEKFVRRVMTPLQYVSSHSKLQKFLSSYEPGVLGYFEFNASPQPPGYLTFFASALYSLNKDYLGTIHFGVITDKLVAKEIPLTNSGSIYLHRHVNTSLFYPHEAMNYTTENICKWALENRETFVRWLRPHGGKSLLLNNELKKGPALLLFLPFDPLAENQTLVDEISRLALAYNSCNRSDRGEAGAEGGRGLPAHPAEDPFPISKSPCCNTVVLPPQLHAISRTHNVCELCVNQTVGIKPSQLSGLRCSFFEIEAALDSFYLKERTFFHIVSKTASLCSNFPSFYSPFSYYTACCRTVNGAVLGFFGPEKTAIPPFETAFSSHGKKWEEEHRRSIPHIEDQKGLLAEHSLPSSGVTGLVCRANKTLNLYLLDSNLFWMYAERLGAPRLTFTRQFATIVDLREEAHYVLDRNQALVRPHLETFIRNYSVLYSPLKRHLVGIPGPVHVSLQHSISEVVTDTFHEVVLKSDKDVLLVYYAPWCGFCAALNHVFIQVAQILPDNFVVARVDVSQNDLPWEFMTDHLPNILLFPRQRKDQSVKFPEDFPITLPNLLKFLLRHSSPPSSAAGSQPCLKECLQQGRVSLLEKEVQKLRAEVGALREAQALLRGQLSDARNEEQRLQQEAWLLRKQQGHLQSHREHLQELYDQKATQLEELAGKLQELAEASKTLLTENALLKVLLASVERKPGVEAKPEISLTQEEEGEDLVTPTAEKNENTHLDARITSERSKENWTE